MINALWKLNCRKHNGFFKPIFVFKTFFSDSSTTRGPLDGIRVCDMTRVLAGPYCTMILGDMGAEIIKVEKPGVGDESRHFGPPFIGGESCYNLSINRNKKSIVVDVKKSEGKEIIYELIKTCDVFIENFVHGRLESMGLGYNQLKEINPRLVYCSITGFGSRGLKHEITRPGYDIVASSIGGLTALNGPKDGDPCRVGIALTDIMTGMYAHGAIISALYQRLQTNCGVKIDTSLLQTQVALMSHIASDFLNAGFKSTRCGTEHRSIVPYQAFDTADDQQVVVAVANDNLFQRFCKACNLNHLLKETRFATNKGRVNHRVEVIDIIQKTLKKKSIKHWLNVLDGAGIPCGPINDIEQVFDTPQVKELDLIQKMSHPTAGEIKVSGPAVDFNGRSILSIPIHPPLLGEHTRHVLKDLLSYDEITIARLLENRVIEEYVRNN